MAVVPSERHYSNSRAPCNTLADLESRMLQSAVEWMLDSSICGRVLQRLGPCSIDFFASRLNNRLPRYASWHPDPFAVETDAFHTVKNGVFQNSCLGCLYVHSSTTPNRVFLKPPFEGVTGHP